MVFLTSRFVSDCCKAKPCAQSTNKFFCKTLSRECIQENLFWVCGILKLERFTVFVVYKMYVNLYEKCQLTRAKNCKNFLNKHQVNNIKNLVTTSWVIWSNIDFLASKLMWVLKCYFYISKYIEIHEGWKFESIFWLYKKNFFWFQNNNLIYFKQNFPLLCICSYYKYENNNKLSKVKY